MLAVGLLMSKQALADSPKIIYDAKFDDKKFSIQNDGSYLIDNKKAGSFIYDDSFLLHVYKSDKKNMLAVNVASEANSKPIYWNLINLTDGKNFKIIANPNGLFEINGKNITVSTKANNCTGTQNMDSDYPTGSYQNKYIAPYFIGFKEGGKTIYQPANPSVSEVFCVRDCTEECVWSPSFYLSFEGLDKNLNNVYFSGQGYSNQGKNWTAYYAYNIKTNKIVKTTLANIKKSKINLTPANSLSSAPSPSVVKSWTKEFGPFNNNYVMGVKNSGVIFGVQQEVAGENRSESVLNLRGTEYRYKSQLTIKTNEEQTAWWAYDESSMNGSLFLNGKVVARTQLALLPHKNDGTINDNMEVNSDLFAINKNGKFAYFDTAGNKEKNRTDLIIVYNGKATVLGEYGFHATLDEYKRSVYLPLKAMLTVDNKLVYAYYDYYKMQVFVVDDSKKYGPYARLNEMTISPNGKNYGWSYVDLKDKKNYVVANNKQYGPYDEFSLLGVSDSVIAWAVKTGNQAFFMVNNKKYGSMATFDNEGVKPTFKASGNNWSVAYTDANYKTHFIVNGEEVVALDDMCQTELASYFCQEMKVGSNYYAYTKRDAKKIIPEGPGGEIIDSPSSVFVNNKNYGVSADEAMGEQQNQFFGSNGWGFINNKREIIVNGKKVYDLPVANDLETVTYPQLYVYGNNWIYFEKITTNKRVQQVENSEGCGSGGCLVTDESVPVKNTIYLNGESKQLPSDIHIFMGDIYLSDKYWAYVYFTKLTGGGTDFSGGHISYGSIGSLK